jgi:hypothetical protein
LQSHNTYEFPAPAGRRLSVSAFLFGVVLLLATATPVRAQIPDAPDLSKMRVKLGPVYLDPTFALTNLGVDTNVFNEADDANPKKDFTITVTPQTALWMRLGRTWINGSLTEDIVWFKKYSSERSANTHAGVTWLVPLTRVSFAVGGDWVSTRERPGFEIDARSRHDEGAVNGAVELRALSKTFFGVKAERRKITFDQNEIFLGTDLRDALTRTVSSEAVTIRNQLTPLTNFLLDVGREQDRFEFDHLRDSDSTRINAGLKFDQFALIKGGVQFGFRDFSPRAPGVPGFQGLTTAVDLTYVVLAATRLAFGTTRDVQYSFDVNQPYYVQTAFNASVAQQVFGPLDVQGRIGAARLAYRTREGASVDNPDRVDHTRTFGGGLGYHLGSDLRLSFNLDRNTRESQLNNRTYHGLRFGTALTYGF